MRITRLSALALGAALMLGTVGGGYVLSASSAAPAAPHSPTGTVSVDLTTVGVLLVKAAPAPADVHCGDRQYVIVTGTFAGDTQQADACIDPGVPSANRADDVAVALGSR